MIILGVLYIVTWAGIALWSYQTDRRRAVKRQPGSSMG